MQDASSPELYSPHTGSTFVIRFPSGTVELTLDEVEDLRRYNDGPFRFFSLIFSGGRECFLPQGTYLLNHPALGEHSLFLVPVGETDKRFRYQAAFSVPKEPAATLTGDKEVPMD
jgi:hypothetical protein